MNVDECRLPCNDASLWTRRQFAAVLCVYGTRVLFLMARINEKRVVESQCGHWGADAGCREVLRAELKGGKEAKRWTTDRDLPNAIH